MECTVSTDCNGDSTEPICDPVSHQCRGCLTHGECDAHAGSDLGVCDASWGGLGRPSRSRHRWAVSSPKRQ